MLLTEQKVCQYISKNNDSKNVLDDKHVSTVNRSVKMSDNQKTTLSIEISSFIREVTSITNIGFIPLK